MLHMETFAEALRSVRQDSGYPSARAFYNRAGGAAFMRCTYRHYLNVESGKAAPNAGLVERIAIGLALASRPDRARRLMLAYVRVMGMSEDLVSLLASSLAQPPDQTRGTPSALVDSMARVNQDRVFNLTAEQSAAVTASAEDYWTWAILSHDRGTWTAQALAEATGFPAKDHERALSRLAKLSLVEKRADGYSCPHVGRVFQHPDKRIYTLGLESLRRFRSDMAAKKGSELLRYHFFSRGPESELKQYIPFLIKAVQGAEVCSAQTRGPDTAFFEVETAVRRILPL